LRTLAEWLAKGEVGGVAWWAHNGGFAAGLVLHPLFVRPRPVIRHLQPDEYGNEGAWL
jgi:membrane associated rhomboid family serine protease